MAGSVVEIAVNSLPFWSRFTITTDLRYDGINLFRTIFNPGREIPVFDYRAGDRSVTALEGSQATRRDTILTVGGQTRGGEQYKIFGVSITKDIDAYQREDVVGSRDNGLRHVLFPASSIQPGNGTPAIVPSVEDFRSLDHLFHEILFKFYHLELQIDGTRRILQWGPALLHPGAGGPQDFVSTTNGPALVQNYMEIKEGIDWNPSGAVDSNMVAMLRADYELAVPTWTAPDGLAPDGTPIPNAIPTPLGRVWTTGYILQFHGYAQSPTSEAS